jgi:nucleotide-binding universal stress UspA family protein
MTIAPVLNRLRNILLADDGSVDSLAAVAMIADLPHPSDCVVTALRVFTPLQTAQQAALEEGLIQTRELLAARGLNARAEFVLGYPAQKILEYAEDHHPDLIVIGARGLRDTARFSMGGVAMHIVEDGRWPVLMVRGPYQGLKRALLVTDGSPCSQIACDYLATFPLPAETLVDVMHVLPPYRPAYVVEPTGVAVPMLTAEEEARLHEADEERAQALLESTRQALAQHNLKAGKVLARGDAATEIVNYAHEQEIALIIAGSRGLGAIRGWLMGSVSRKLAHYAECSVLIARCTSKPAEA